MRLERVRFAGLITALDCMRLTLLAAHLHRARLSLFAAVHLHRSGLTLLAALSLHCKARSSALALDVELLARLAAGLHPWSREAAAMSARALHVRAATMVLLGHGEAMTAATVGASASTTMSVRTGGGWGYDGQRRDASNEHDLSHEKSPFREFQRPAAERVPLATGGEGHPTALG